MSIGSKNRAKQSIDGKKLQYNLTFLNFQKKKQHNMTTIKYLRIKKKEKLYN